MLLEHDATWAKYELKKSETGEATSLRVHLASWVLLKVIRSILGLFCKIDDSFNSAFGS